MSLTETFLDIVKGWEDVFPQRRSYLRALRQGLGGLLCLGRRTLSRIIWTNGGAQQSWSAEYHLHSRTQWNPQDLFEPVLRKGLDFCRGRYVGIAVDDTRLKKTGRCIKQAFYQRDPLSPPFHWNLMLGLRFLQASLLLPLHRRHPVGCRSLPVRFQEVSPVKRPRRKASPEEWKTYRLAVKLHNLSRSFVATMLDLRQTLSRIGASQKTILFATDGSFCNRTVFTSTVNGVEIVARARKDAKLCRRAPASSRRFYGLNKFTPEQVRTDDSIPWESTKLFYGSKRRPVRYKTVSEILWQGGARRRPLRLIVVAPTPYRKRKSGRLYYRSPAYLLTTDLSASPKLILQTYFDRWQIEVNHREEKDTLGVGEAQLWNPTAVPKQPVLSVASYSALLLASLLTFGPDRGEAYHALPKWRRKANRPSCLDLVTLLRKEVTENPALLTHLNASPQLVAAAAA